MKRLFFSIFICSFFLGFKANAQSSPVPDNYELKTKEDYAKYEADVIKTVDWLQQTLWTEDPDKRKTANSFLMAWITGSPTVSISINSDILMKYCKKNGGLLFTYMGGYTKFALQHKNDFSKTQADVFAVKSMIDKYNAEPSHIKDPNMEKLTKIDKDGKLEDWVKSDFEK